VQSEAPNSGTEITPLVGLIQSTLASHGILSVDVGSPMMSMHSLHKSAGALDPHCMRQALAEVFNRS
jgi:aspartyl aminopeptidase